MSAMHPTYRTRDQALTRMRLTPSASSPENWASSGPSFDLSYLTSMSSNFSRIVGLASSSSSSSLS